MKALKNIAQQALVGAALFVGKKVAKKLAHKMAERVEYRWSKRNAESNAPLQEKPTPSK